MKNSKTTILVFAYYLAIMSAILLFWPSLFLYLGFDSTPMPWVAICGYLIGILSFLYFMAAHSGNRQFYSWTVAGRVPLIVFSLVLVAMGLAPPVMILLGLVDTLGAIWTAWALRCDTD